jgi:hypothetical protein
LATLLQCPNCFAPLPPPGSGHTTCRFCGATSTTTIANIPGSFGAAVAAPPQPAADPFGAKALALDFQRQHGVDLTTDSQAMERLGRAWAKAQSETVNGAKTTVNLPFLTSTRNGPLHYERELDAKTMTSLLAVARKLG